jgi:hypothetical protein
MPAVMLVLTLGQDERGAEPAHRDLHRCRCRWYVAKQVGRSAVYHRAVELDG